MYKSLYLLQSHLVLRQSLKMKILLAAFICSIFLLQAMQPSAGDYLKNSITLFMTEHKKI
jgi:hypothetical protein